MSVIEDGWKVMQDFLAPELRAISVGLDALEKRFDGVDKKFDGVDKKFEAMDRKIDTVEQRAEKRHTEVLQAIAKMSEISSLRERLARLEAQETIHQ